MLLYTFVKNKFIETLAETSTVAGRHNQFIIEFFF